MSHRTFILKSFLTIVIFIATMVYVLNRNYELILDQNDWQYLFQYINNFNINKSILGLLVYLFIYLIFRIDIHELDSFFTEIMIIIGG